ncbi:MAG TPA: hypothetical protein VF680_16750 [Allosphingosinicella sp.]|jgi:hypothetical protein
MPDRKKPIKVKDKNDPRYKAYKDSLDTFNFTKNKIKSIKNNPDISAQDLIEQTAKLKDFKHKDIESYKYPGKTNIQPDFYYGTGDKGKPFMATIPRYKEPQQPIILESDKPREKVNPLDLKFNPIGLKTSNTIPETDSNVTIYQPTAKNFKVRDEIIQPFGGSTTDYIINGPEDLMRSDLGPGNKRTITPQYAMGGTLNTNNKQTMLNEFNEGGSHETNPLGGIPQGNGNTVEQGETRKGDFIYSDRITLTPDVIEQFALPKSLTHKTVAEASKIMNNKFEGRNDRISDSTKRNLLDKVAQAQETIKAKQAALAEAQNANATQVPDMMNGMIPPGFEGQMVFGGDMMTDDMGMDILKTGATAGLNALLPGSGAIAGPAIDMIGGAINKHKMRQSFLEDERMSTMRDINMQRSDFAKGGPLKKPGLVTDDYTTPSIDGISLKTLPFNLDYNNQIIGQEENPTIAPLNPVNYKTPQSPLSKVGDVLGQAARYAPIAANVMQLNRMKGPAQQRLQRLDQRFNPEYVDERSGQIIADNEMNNTIGAITQMGASEGAMRNSLLGAGLNKAKALSDIQMKAAAQNMNTNMQGQEFNANINRVNLHQANTEMDINDRNSANFRSQKSKLVAGIAEGIGDVGKEETYKKLAKETFGYKWNGKYYIKPDGTTITPQEFKLEADSKNTTQNRLGGFLNKKLR